MRVGQMDGAALTTVGLAQIVRPVLVLQAPGVCTSYGKIDAVRAQLASEFEREFDTAGYKLMGWGDTNTSNPISRFDTPDESSFVPANQEGVDDRRFQNVTE